MKLYHLPPTVEYSHVPTPLYLVKKGDVFTLHDTKGYQAATRYQATTDYSPSSNSLGVLTVRVLPSGDIRRMSSVEGEATRKWRHIALEDFGQSVPHEVLVRWKPNDGEGMLIAEHWPTVEIISQQEYESG